MAAPPSLKSWSEDIFRPQTTRWKAAKAKRPLVEMFRMNKELLVEVVAFVADTSIVIWSESSRMKLDTSLEKINKRRSGKSRI